MSKAMMIKSKKIGISQILLDLVARINSCLIDASILSIYYTNNNMMNSNYLSNIIPSKGKNLMSISIFAQLFLCSFFICVFAEGTGILPRFFLLPIFVIFPLILLPFYSKNQWVYGKKNVFILLGSFIYLVYLLYICLFSFNRQVSFEFVVFLFSLFLLFLVVRQKWMEIQQPLLYSILGLGILFCLYSLLVPITLHYNLFYLYPENGYQYIYSLFGSHSHLGDFLVFPLLISFYFYIQQKRKWWLLLFSFYFSFFLFSYSRTAYIGFFIGFILMCWNFRQEISKKQKKIALSLLIGSIMFFPLIATNTLQQRNFNSIFEIFHIIPVQKSVIETREGYVLQGVKGFLTYRYYGTGLGNFGYISKMFVEVPGQETASSHNVFMDVLVETGTVSFVFFIFFTVLLLRAIKKNHSSIFAVLLLSWFIMIQFDYLHQMYSYLTLFPLFLTGLLYQERYPKKISNGSEIIIRSEVIITCMFLLSFLAIYFASTILLFQKKYEFSRTIYPLQRPAYENDLDKKNLLETYIRLFPGEYTGWFFLAKTYEKEGTLIKAIENYEKGFWLDPFQNLLMAERIYDLKVKYQNKKEAKQFADKLFIRLNNDSDNEIFGYKYWLFMNKFCQKVYDLRCVYSLK